MEYITTSSGGWFQVGKGREWA